ELARRGASAGAGARAVIDGEVRASTPAPSTGGPRTYRVALEAQARLRIDGKVVSEKTVRREADFLAGADPNESEARRAIALRRLAADVARELVRAFEG
ncbi:MAG TPA: LPS assembly lipoprotein LptE, partial [Anaeromyxobacteraceae bacterium]|nr:LPS assembly lipoprotein LptE [Anaeromyxobacteraceae bacterium]